MAADYLVIGHFSFVDDTHQAIIKMREKGVNNVTLYSPVPNHDLEEELYRGQMRSPVRRFTLIGAFLGCCLAFLMTIWMSMDWPLRTSAKSIVSIPPFVVIGFECTVLIGGIVTLLGMLHLARIPNIFRSPGFRPDFTNNVFGLVARVPKEESETIRDEFQRCGAAKVEIEYVR